MVICLGWGRQSLVDVSTIAIAFAALGITMLRWRIPEPIIVTAAALLGIVLISG